MIMLMALLEGCASAPPDPAAGPTQVQAAQSVRFGVIADVRDVTLFEKSGTGATFGSVTASAQEGAGAKSGLDVTVRLDSGAVVAVVQNAGEKFSVGDGVRILPGNGASRVTH